LPIRLLVGLHFMKHVFGESGESMVERFVENPYWQYFCGFEYFQHTFPLDPTSLVRWRKRIKPEGMEKLLQETIATAQRGDLLRKSDVARVNADTTVQEKAIAFPTDARLYQKMRRALVTAARREGIELRQSLRAGGKAGAAPARPVRSCPPTEAFEAGDEAASDVPGPCDAGHPEKMPEAGGKTVEPSFHGGEDLPAEAERRQQGVLGARSGSGMHREGEGA
jgi:hypothetical protein